MIFIVIPSLEHVALVSVAASLWNQHDIRILIREFLNSALFLQVKGNCPLYNYSSINRKETWLKIEEKVIEKVPQLMITVILKEKLLGYIQAVGLQILRWMEYHRIYCCLDRLYLPYKFFWTPQGIVDKKKTAEEFVKDQNMDIGTRYKFACIYCLENDVRKLWNRMPKSIQNFLFSEENNMTKNMLKTFLTFWRMYLRGEVAKFGNIIRRRLNLKCSAYRYMFRSAADGGNKAATDYFLQKLFLRKKSLFKAALHVVKSRLDSFPSITKPPNEYYSELLCFLLSQMNDEQQVKIFKKVAWKVSLCLLDWPWQNFFINVARCLWNFLSGNQFYSLLFKLIHKVLYHCIDYNYRKLFRELWQQSPQSLKRYIMHHCIPFVFYLLFKLNDKQIMKLVIQDATLAEKHAFIFSEKGRSFCEDNIQQCDLLKYFLQLFISSKDEIKKFKQQYEDYIERNLNGVRDPKCTEFLKLLDDLVHVDYKRKKDEGDSASKRHCNTDLILSYH